MPGRQSILLVNQHYYPDVASTGQHLTDLAEYLASDGYAVHVLCSRGRYLAGRMAVPDRETRHGVSIRRVRTTALGRGSHIGRLVDYATFYVHVLVALLFGPRRDGVLFLTTPPLLCVLGALARLLRGQRYGVWSMDLHPDAEIASGMLAERGLLARALSRLNAAGYRYADFVVDLGPFMKRRILAMGVDPDRTRTIHVWNNREEIVPVAIHANPLRHALGLRDRFVVMYSGNAGIVHDFQHILEAMRRCKEDAGVYFLFVGDGPRRGAIEDFAREHGVKNFEYRSYFPREELTWSLGLADVHLLSLRERFVGISVPGKLYGIMAAARPALFVGPRHCESAETILATGCGAVISPDTRDPAGDIVNTIQQWRRSPGLVMELGRRGREAFLKEFERESNCRMFADTVARAWLRGEASSTAAERIPLAAGYP